MVYVVTLSVGEHAENLDKFRLEMRLTKALPKGLRSIRPLPGPPIALVLSDSNADGTERRRRHLAWIGLVARYNTVGAVDHSITIDPFRECFMVIPLDGLNGFLGELSDDANRQFTNATSQGAVGIIDSSTWEEINTILRVRYPPLADLLDWLLAQANPPIFDSRDPADLAWQEQRDATGCLLRIADFPLPALAAWHRPASRDAPYLAGLITQPVEQSLIEHDIRVAGDAFDMFSEWRTGDEVRCDIHVLRDADGRRLEIANVNATSVEARTGTDMIYYHEPTHSFVLVQYKRLDPQERSMYVDDRLRRQLDRLDTVAKHSRPAAKPDEWRLGNDCCFLKLAYWPQGIGYLPVERLTPGMYLPLSYVRLLLEDDCTRGADPKRQARKLGYKQVGRYLINSQFIELVKHGLAGTIDVSAEQLRDIVSNRVNDGQSVVVATEHSSETARERQARLVKRGARVRSFAHTVTRSTRI